MIGFTPGITVDGGYTVRLTALDATTGNTVAGVNVSAAFVLATDVFADDQPPNVQKGPIFLAPGPAMNA